MATKQELQGLQNLASQYGGADSQQFKDYVNQTAGAGSYDKLMAGLKKQASVQTAPAPTNVGKIDTTTGQEIQQAPKSEVSAPIPTQAPTTPQPIQQAPKSEVSAPKVEVKTDINEAINPKWQQSINTALESGQDVKSKLDEGLKAGTIDQKTYNQANNYLNQKQQQAGDQKAQQLNDENFIFEALQTGQNIKGTTPAYFKAKSRYDIASKYQNLTEAQLYNAYINGEISSQLEKDIAGNPYLAIAKEKYNQKLVTDNINQEASYMLNAYNKANGGTASVKTEKTALETLNEKFLALFNNMGKSETEILSFKEHLAQNYPSLVEETKELNAKNKQVKELADQRDARIDEIIKENPGISINRATMLAAKQNKDINNEIKSLSYEIANLSANVQYQTSMADKEYGYLLQERSRQDKLDAEQRGYMFNMLQDEIGYQRNLESEERQRQFQLEDRAYQEQLAQKQLEQKFAYEYGDINSTDENVQRVAFERIAEDLQKQYAGMPFRRTVSEMAMDFMNEYKNGKSLSDISAETIQAIQNAPAYRQWAMNKGLIAKETTTQDWAKLSDTELYNQRTGEIKSITPKQAGVIDLQVGDIGGECGTYARKYTGITTGLDAVVGTTAKERVKNFTDTEPKEGGLVLFTGGNYDKQYGHIAVVTSVNGDGTINITESNLNNDGKVTTRTVGVDEVTGFYNDTPLAGGTGGYTQDKIELLAEIGQIQSETEKRKALEGSGFTLKDLTKYKSDASAGRIPPTEGQKQAALKIISDIQGIAKTDWTDATGKFDYSRLLGLQGATNAGVLIENLRDAASFNNLGMLKGPMSDKDIAFLKSVSSKLDPIQSNKQFEKNIVEMYNIAARKAGLKEITKLSEVPKDRILPGQGQIAPTQTIQTNQGYYSEEDLLNSLK